MSRKKKSIYISGSVERVFIFLYYQPIVRMSWFLVKIEKSVRRITDTLWSACADAVNSAMDILKSIEIAINIEENYVSIADSGAQFIVLQSFVFLWFPGMRTPVLREFEDAQTYF